MPPKAPKEARTDAAASGVALEQPPMADVDTPMQPCCDDEGSAEVSGLSMPEDMDPAMNAILIQFADETRRDMTNLVNTKVTRLIGQLGTRVAQVTQRVDVIDSKVSELANGQAVMQSTLDSIARQLRDLRASDAPTAHSSAPPVGVPEHTLPPHASRASGHEAPRPAHPGGGEHVVLLQFSKPRLKQTMAGLEQSYRSRFAAMARPTHIESPPYHDFLTVKFSTHVEAADYTSRLGERCTDEAGRRVPVIHKGAKAARPPHIVRRGQALKPFLRHLCEDVGPGRGARPASQHQGRPVVDHLCCCVKEKADSARDLGRIRCRERTPGSSSCSLGRPRTTTSTRRRTRRSTHSSRRARTSGPMAAPR